MCNRVQMHPTFPWTAETWNSTWWPLLTQGLPARFRPAWVDGMCLNHTEGGMRGSKASKLFLDSTLNVFRNVYLGFIRLTKQFEEYIFIWGTWHFMSFMDGKESHYLQVFSNVIVFRFQSYKLFWFYVFGLKVPEIVNTPPVFFFFFGFFFFFSSPACHHLDTIPHDSP